MRNRWGGRCLSCGRKVAAWRGEVVKVGAGWRVRCLACGGSEAAREWSGSQAPDDPDNVWIDDATGERVNALTGERTRPASVSSVYVIGGREYYRNRRGRCEDAPCCGCCTI